MNALTVCLICVIFFKCHAKLREIDIPNQGKIIGVESSKLRIQKIVAYYGIPYAQPPVNQSRFAPPMTNPLPSWNDVRKETTYAHSCHQRVVDYTEKPFFQLLDNLNFTMSEDCLYLNIFVPYGDAPTPGFATIIWFHPGNFTMGTPAMWNPHTLVYRQRIIVVTVSWRLNIFGFFTTIDGVAPGNFGLMDQQAAMKWVKNNIERFGGDPNNISLMGYGTGATSIGIHMVSPGSRGLFNKAIVMSGNIISTPLITKPEDHKAVLDRLAESFLCNRPTSQLIECLRYAEPQLLVQQTRNVNWGPILDTDISNNTPFLAELPMKYFETGEYEKVPLLTGYSQMERVLEIDSLRNITSISLDYLQNILTELISNDIPVINNTESSCVYNYDHIVDAVMFFYGPTGHTKDSEKIREIIINFLTERNYAAPTFSLANYMGNEQPTYVYRFDIKPSTPAAVSQLPDWVTVPHLFDLVYVWGLPYWSTNEEWDIRDKRISDTIMSFWTNFAKSSNPTENGIYPVTWNNFTSENPGILIIDGTFNMSNNKNLNYKAFEFWNKYYPKVKTIASQCCEAFDSSSTMLNDNLIIITFQFILVYLNKLL